MKQDFLSYIDILLMIIIFVGSIFFGIIFHDLVDIKQEISTMPHKVCWNETDKYQVVCSNNCKLTNSSIDENGDIIIGGLNPNLDCNIDYNNCIPSTRQVCEVI